MTDPIITTFARKGANLFPLFGVYKNIALTSINVKIQIKKISDDNISIVPNTWSCYYQEIAG